MSIHRFSLSLMFFQIFLLFPSLISAIRNHIGLPLVNTTCRSTVQGRYLLTDDNGHVHENAYHSDYHHCFSLPSYASGVNSTQLEFRLNGVNVIIGRQGESCDSVCKSNGQSCVSNKILVLNHCDIIQKYLSCKGGCIASVGPDQPAEVSYNAPKELNPGACLYSSAQSMLSCDGSHPHTKRLCPCA